jgi:uncharacterized membrane protein
MYLKIKKFADQILVGSNIAVLFLVLFDHQLVIPNWLALFGRIHPMLLHFPIVLLIMAGMMFLLNTYIGNEHRPFFRKLTGHILLMGTLFAGITVVMGLFLSREPGYSGDTLKWHKWTGLAVFCFSSLIYIFRNSGKINTVLKKTSIALLFVFIILTGHYGANLTHGEGFIFEPILQSNSVKQVDVDQALVFEDVVLPILEQKCVSCHNADKLKGELNLTAAAHLSKGGKSGALFVPGNAEMSLLMQRVHLPIEEKKHMPPSGKPQLTPDEVNILTAWIQQNADFKKKVSELSVDDPLKIWSVARLNPSTTEVEVYDFDAASEKDIDKLSNDYRTIAPLAKQVPALQVNFYSQAAFKKEHLKELDPIKKQIVFLNLNKMPIEDSDLKQVSKFENLRKIEMNFTNISAQGLQELTSLKALKTLTISGTPVTYAELKGLLPQFKTLKTVSIWDTKMTQAEMDQLIKENPKLTILKGFVDDGTSILTLNPPQIKNKSVVFSHTTELELFHPIKGVTIRYTTDGTEPDSIHSPIFKAQTLLDKRTGITAKAFKEGWYGSKSNTFQFYKSTFKPDSIQLIYTLNAVHKAQGNHTFFNGILGEIGANNPAWATNWAGARNDDMGIICLFNAPVSISSLGMRYMIEENSRIFPPEIIEIWGGDHPDRLKLLSKFKAPMPARGDKPTIKDVEGTFPQTTVSCIKIIAKPVQSLPDWHPAKGNRALLLVDEMFLN